MGWSNVVALFEALSSTLRIFQGLGRRRASKVLLYGAYILYPVVIYLFFFERWTCLCICFVGVGI